MAKNKKWRILFYLTAGYCLIVLIAAVFPFVMALSIGDSLIIIDWSCVPLKVIPFLWLTCYKSLWLPVSVMVLTVPAVVGCFRFARGNNGRSLLKFYVSGTVSAMALLNGTWLVMKYFGLVLISSRYAAVEVVLDDLIGDLVCTGVLLIPVVAVLVGIRYSQSESSGDT